MRKCNIEGCEKESVNRGYKCAMHYARISKHGSPFFSTGFDARNAIIEGDTAKIPLGIFGKYGYAIVDKEYAHLDMYKRVISKSGHVITGRPTRLIHRIILGIEGQDIMVDHIDRDPLNNRVSNLRIADKTINSINRGVPRHNTTGCRGVSKAKNGKYECYITIGGKRRFLGYYLLLSDAIARRKEAEIVNRGYNP